MKSSPSRPNDGHPGVDRAPDWLGCWRHPTTLSLFLGSLGLACNRAQAKEHVFGIKPGSFAAKPLDVVVTQELAADLGRDGDTSIRRQGAVEVELESGERRKP